MLLQRLREYSERLDLPPALYREMPVRYLVDLRADGAFDAFTDTSDLSSRSTKRGTSRRVPFIVRTSATRPLLFSDTSEYTFGIGAGDNPARTESRHAAYLELITECAAVTGLDDARAVEHFLKSTSREALGLPADFDATGLITFRVDGRFIVDHPDIQRFWAMRFAPEREAEDEDQQCFVCGQALPLRPNVPELIEGIPGGQTRKALVFVQDVLQLKHLRAAFVEACRRIRRRQVRAA